MENRNGQYRNYDSVLKTCRTIYWCYKMIYYNFLQKHCTYTYIIGIPHNNSSRWEYDVKEFEEFGISERFL